MPISSGSNPDDMETVQKIVGASSDPEKAILVQAEATIEGVDQELVKLTQDTPNVLSKVMDLQTGLNAHRKQLEGIRNGGAQKEQLLKKIQDLNSDLIDKASESIQLKGENMYKNFFGDHLTPLSWGEKLPSVWEKPFTFSEQEWAGQVTEQQFIHNSAENLAEEYQKIGEIMRDTFVGLHDRMANFHGGMMTLYLQSCFRHLSEADEWHSLQEKTRGDYHGKCSGYQPYRKRIPCQSSR